MKQKSVVFRVFLYPLVSLSTVSVQGALKLLSSVQSLAYKKFTGQIKIGYILLHGYVFG